MKKLINAILLWYLRRFRFDHGKRHVAKWVKLPEGDAFIPYTNAWGTTFHLRLNEYQMKQIYLYDLFEKNTIVQLQRLFRKKRSQEKVVFLDVGANIGFYALTIEAMFPGGNCEVHAFEPNPYTFSLLEKNIAANSPKKIRLNPFGLSDKVGNFTLSYHERNLGTASLYPGTAADLIQVQVDLKPLDSYCTENGIKSVDIIKVDIEGAELDFLRGAQNIISQSPDCVLICEIVEENCKRSGYTAESLFKFIQDMGFTGYIPKAWPFGLKRIDALPAGYHDNIIFLKGKPD